MTRIPRLSPTASPVGQAVHRIMVARKRSPKELALKAGLGESYVYDLLSGDSQNPKTAELKKLVAELGCELSDLESPGTPSGDHLEGQNVDFSSILPLFPDEFALIRMFRYLHRRSKDLVLMRVSELLPDDLRRGGSDEG